MLSFIPKNYRNLILVASALLFVAAALLLPLKKEPAYAGKTLSQWAMLLAQSDYPNRNLDAENAIVHIGSPAAPYLTNWVQYVPEQPKGRGNRVIAELRSKIEDFGNPFYGSQQELRAVGAATALCLLGPQRTRQLAELAGLATTPACVKGRAVTGLCKLGPQGVPYLINLLINCQEHWAAIGLASMGTNAYPAIPALIQSLACTNLDVSDSAAAALGVLRYDAEHVVPVLTSYLSITNHHTRMVATSALARFGSAARCAAPRILPMLTDPSPSAREMATNFFLTVAPDMLSSTP